MPTIDIRRPERRAGGMILVVVAVALAADFVRSGAPAGAFVLVGVAAAGIRMARERVWTDDTALHARNFWRTYTASRLQIVEFLVEDFDGPRTSRTRTTWIRLVDHRTLALSATRISYMVRSGWRSRAYTRNQADDVCDRLNAWLRPRA